MLEAGAGRVPVPHRGRELIDPPVSFSPVGLWPLEVVLIPIRRVLTLCPPRCGLVRWLSMNGVHRSRSDILPAICLVQPVLVSGIHKRLNATLWKADSFNQEFADHQGDLLNCKDQVVSNSGIKEFWDGFEDIASEFVATENSGRSELIPSKWCLFLDSSRAAEVQRRRAGGLQTEGLALRRGVHGPHALQVRNDQPPTPRIR